MLPNPAIVVITASTSAAIVRPLLACLVRIRRRASSANRRASSPAPNPMNPVIGIKQNTSPTSARASAVMPNPFRRSTGGGGRGGVALECLLPVARRELLVRRALMVGS
jgi:hypothetical protein